MEGHIMIEAGLMDRSTAFARCIDSYRGKGGAGNSNGVDIYS